MNPYCDRTELFVKKIFYDQSDIGKDAGKGLWAIKLTIKPSITYTVRHQEAPESICTEDTRWKLYSIKTGRQQHQIYD